MNHTFPYVHEMNSLRIGQVQIGDILTLLKEDGSEYMTCVAVPGECGDCALDHSDEGGCLNYNFACPSGMMVKRVADTMEEL